MSNKIKRLYELEKCLTNHKTQKFLPLFKELLRNNDSECKEILTSNPGLSIYFPKETKNLESTKNVIIIIHELSRTGAPVVALDAAKTLQKNGYFVTFYTIRRGPLLKELLDIGIPVIFDQKLEITNYDKNFILSEDSNLYIDTIAPSFDKTLAITAVFYNLVRHFSDIKHPTIWWLHEGSATYDNLSHVMPHRLNQEISVYAGGQYALNMLKKYGLEYNAKVLNYGVDDVFKDKEINDSTDTHDTVSFILPGSLGKRKGQSVLLEAIQRLPKEYKEKSRFIFIGDILSKADIDGVKAKNQILSMTKKMKNIEYHRSLSRDELFDYYKKVDAIILPSLDDPMPVVATEMLMMKKIVVCSESTGTSFYLKDKENGFVFRTGDTDQLCDTIKYIIDHRDTLSAIGEKSRKVYENNFKMEIFEKNLLKIISEEE